MCGPLTSTFPRRVFKGTRIDTAITGLDTGDDQILDQENLRIQLVKMALERFSNEDRRRIMQLNSQITWNLWESDMRKIRRQIIAVLANSIEIAIKEFDGKKVLTLENKFITTIYHNLFLSILWKSIPNFRITPHLIFQYRKVQSDWVMQWVQEGMAQILP